MRDWARMVQENSERHVRCSWAIEVSSVYVYCRRKRPLLSDSDDGIGMGRSASGM